MPAPRKSTSRQRKRPTAGSPEPVAAPTPNEPDTRWWVLVASSIPELGAGRYGVWEDKPKVEWEEGEGTLVAAIKGKVGEPELHINMEPGALDWRDDLPDDHPTPMRVAIFFTGISKDQEANDINTIIELVINHAATLGLTFEWGASDVMDLVDVVDGSPLAQAIQQGRP